jgi:TolB-like protein/tetratricopeptide (TPR) repeat protein
VEDVPAASDAGGEFTDVGESIVPHASRSPRESRAAGEGASLRARLGGPLILALLGLSLLAALAALYRPWNTSGSRRRDATAAPGNMAISGAPTGASAGQLPRTIAVLPFKNLGAGSGVGDEEYLGLGISDALIMRLGHSRRIIVRPTSAVRRYGDPQQDPLAAGRQQGVETVLDGSIQRSGERIRVTVQLFRVATGEPLWTGQFDERFTDIFAVQDSISERVMRALMGELSADEAARLRRQGAGSVEAHRAHLKGRYFWNKRTNDGFEKAVGFFRQAIALDPNYAEAHAGLADAYQFLGSSDVEERADNYARARAAAQRALELDETLAGAHASLGLIAMNFDWDWASADREFSRAVELDPNYATARHWWAEYLAAVGRFDEALAEIEQAQSLDPLSVTISADKGKLLYFARRYDEAIGQLSKTLEMEPDFMWARLWLALSYTAKGLPEQTLAELEKARAFPDGLSLMRAGGAYARAMLGRKDEARKSLAELKALAAQGRVDPFIIVLVYIGLEEKDQAFAWLNKEYEAHSVGLTSLKVCPLYDSLRPDPRFADLMRRVGLAP